MLSSHWKEIQSAVHHFGIFYLEEGVNGKWRSNIPSCGTRNPSLLKHLPLHPENGNIHELYVRPYLLLEDGEEEETHIPDLRRWDTLHRHLDSWFSVFFLSFLFFDLVGCKTVCSWIPGGFSITPSSNKNSALFNLWGALPDSPALPEPQNSDWMEEPWDRSRIGVVPGIGLDGEFASQTLDANN